MNYAKSCVLQKQTFTVSVAAKNGERLAARRFRRRVCSGNKKLPNTLIL